MSPNTDPISNPPIDTQSAPLCEACAAVQQNWRRAPGHAELVQGANRKELRGNTSVTLTRYHCDRCGTAWDYENNKANQHAGWSIVGSSPKGPTSPQTDQW